MSSSTKLMHIEDLLRPRYNLKAQIIEAFRNNRWRSATVSEIADALPEKNKAHEESITNALSRISRGRETFDEASDTALFQFEGKATYRLLDGVQPLDGLERLDYPDYAKGLVDGICKKANISSENARDKHRKMIAFIATDEKVQQMLEKRKADWEEFMRDDDP